MAEPDQEWIESLLRKRETLQKAFDAYQAKYKRDLDAIDVLLSSELAGSQSVQPVRMSSRRRIIDQQKSIARQEEQAQQDAARRDRYRRQALIQQKHSEQERVPDKSDSSTSAKSDQDSAPAVATPIVVDDDANTREIVSAVLNAMGAPMRMADVVDVVQGMTSSPISPDTIRSVLQRMVHSGEARRTERGTYESVTKQDEDAFVRDLLKDVVTAKKEPDKAN